MVSQAIGTTEGNQQHGEPAAGQQKCLCLPTPESQWHKADVGGSTVEFTKNYCQIRG